MQPSGNTDAPPPVSRRTGVRPTMLPRLRTVLVAAGLCAAAVVPALLPARNDPALSSRSGRRVAVGMTRAQVQNAMARPADEKLSADVWLYWDFRAKGRSATDPHPALIVVFASGRVHSIRLTSATDARLLLEHNHTLPPRRSQTPPPPRAVLTAGRHQRVPFPPYQRG
jgi:hypothetical protein